MRPSSYECMREVAKHERSVRVTLASWALSKLSKWIHNLMVAQFYNIIETVISTIKLWPCKNKSCLWKTWFFFTESAVISIFLILKGISLLSLYTIAATFQLILSSAGSCRPSEGPPRPHANFFRYIQLNTYRSSVGSGSLLCWVID